MRVEKKLLPIEFIGTSHNSVMQFMAGPFPKDWNTNFIIKDW